MLGPMIFIGVGGSGGNTVRSVREFLWQKLRSEGWEGEFPECWQTLWIDTISQQGRGGYAAPLLPDNSYHGLVAGGVNYPVVAKNIQSSIPDNQWVESLAGWMPPSSPVPIAKGAGQFRAIGRTIGVWQFKQTKSFLESALERMNSIQGGNDLAALSQLFKVPVDAKPGTPTAFVISSMAGGSGSGLFQDVAHMLKLINPQYDNFTHVMLYGADVFKLSVDPDMMKSIPGNTLGGIGETMSGVWRSGLSEASESLFTKAGFNSVGIKRYGGKHHWLIGARNNEAALGGSTDEIYRAVGSSLAALAVSPPTLDWLNDFVLTNVFAGSATNVFDNTLLKDPNNGDHYQPYASMGFSRITLGMDYFRNYAAQAITKSAVKRMLWPDYEPTDIESQESPAQKISNLVDHSWNDFRKNSGLDERNPANDIIDALKPKDESKFEEFARAAIDTAAGRDPSLEPSKWESRISSFFKANVRELVSKQQVDVYKSAQEWTELIQEKILSATAEAIGLSGFRVTLGLLTKMRAEIDFLVNVELPADAAKRSRVMDEVSGRVLKLLSTGKSKITKTDSEVDAARDTIKKATNIITEAERINLAIDLLRDLDKNFIAGLLASIEDAAESLKASLTADDLDYPSFPDLDQEMVPNRFAPPNTEQSLIDYRDFRVLLEQWSKNAISSEIQGSWKTRLVDRAIRSVPFDESGDTKPQRLIKLEPRWVPSNSSARAQLGNATAAGFRIKADVQDFFEQTKNMLSYYAGSLSDQVNMGLRNYIENVTSPAEKDKRKKAFDVALVAALRYCGPMVAENATVLSVVHPDSAMGHYISFSPIPFEGTDLEGVSRDRILSADPSNSLVKRTTAFTNSEAINKIEFYSTLKNARNPLVFDSLMRPISEDWKKKCNTAAGRQQFWTLRRSKPLLESVPAAQENVDRMITGWFALAFTGARKYSEDINLGRKVSIYDSGKRDWVDFPHPLLGLPDPYQEHDMLPAVLTSLSLALVLVNEQESLNPLVAYQALIMAGSDDNNFGYRKLILDYIAGRGPVSDSLTPDERRAQLVTNLGKSLEYFEGIFASIESSKDPFSASRIYEIRHPLLQAFASLIQAASAKELPAGEGISVIG
jgi:hypothetical protein